MTNIEGCVFAFDIASDCQKTYERNYELKPEGDITKIDSEDIPEFNVLCGGFPCVSFMQVKKKIEEQIKKSESL